LLLHHTVKGTEVAAVFGEGSQEPEATPVKDTCLSTSNVPRGSKTSRGGSMDWRRSHRNSEVSCGKESVDWGRGTGRASKASRNSRISQWAGIAEYHSPVIDEDTAPLEDEETKQTGSSRLALQARVLASSVAFRCACLVPTIRHGVYGAAGVVSAQCVAAVASAAFRRTVMAFIFVNTIVLALEHDGQSPLMSEVTHYISMFFTMFFAAEICIKIVGLGLLQ